ncbi:MAG: hypothetical protein WCG25_00330 [bacterium]
MAEIKSGIQETLEILRKEGLIVEIPEEESRAFDRALSKEMLIIKKESDRLQRASWVAINKREKVSILV